MFGRRPKPNEATAAHLAQLRDAAYGLEDRYIVSSELHLHDPALAPSSSAPSSSASATSSASAASAQIELSGAFGKLTLPASLTAARDQVRALAAACKPAPFGLGHETVVDPNVRRALTLPLAEVAVSGIPAAEWAAMLETIWKTLVPDAERIEAVPDKLNLYLVDGHFTAHRDTPGDPSHFGTLVLCLPLVFAGGDLTVRHNGSETAVAWAPRVYDTRSYERRDLDNVVATTGWNPGGDLGKVVAKVPTPLVHYAAFFGHCEHEIAPVTFGVRLTLAYKLIRHDAPAPVPRPLGGTPLNPALLARAGFFASRLRAALADPEFVPKGGPVGFACFHLYEDADLDAIPPATPKERYRAPRLKGADYLVSAVANSLGLAVEPMRIFATSGDDGDQYAIAHFPKSDQPKHYAQKVHTEIGMAWGAEPDTISTMLGDGDQDALESAMWAVPLPRSNRNDPYPESITPVKNLRELWFSGTGYFGNEASVYHAYTLAALIVTVPESGSTERDALASAAAAAAATADGANAGLQAALARLPGGSSSSSSSGSSSQAAGAAAAAAPAGSAAADKESDSSSNLRIVRGASLAQLKSLARLLGQPVSGTKDVLLERVTSKIDRVNSDMLADAGLPLVPILSPREIKEMMAAAARQSIGSVGAAAAPAPKRPKLESDYNYNSAGRKRGRDWSAAYFA